MPFAILKSIREVSSQDKLHCAANLLQHEPGKKWKTEVPGESSAYVIIEMESEYSIKGIDIGNECSAFVEVLVGGPACPNDKFKEILITSSFMTPTESRTCSMTNRVRCFNREILVPDTVEQKWKLIKIMCTQPFNKDIKYGLSFIKIHVDEPLKTKNNVGSTSLVKTKVGSFSLREDSPDSESESTTALFNRWKTSKTIEPNGISTVPRNPSPAVLKKPNDSFTLAKKTSNSANESFTLAKKNSNSTTPSSSSKKKDTKEESPEIQDRNRRSLLFTDDVDEKKKNRLDKLEKAIASDRERVQKEIEEAKKSKKPASSKTERKPDETPKRQKTHPEKEKSSKSPKSEKKTNTPTSSSLRRPSSSPCVSDTPKKPKLDKPVQYRPFNKLLTGVVLVISGIQNPDRADLRNKALALGAKYKGDWDGSSTHLICAFKNTPKYNQVKGQGKIVTRSWIEECHSKKRKLPWRRFALDGDELLKPESEDEILDESLKPIEGRASPKASRKDSEDSDDILATYDKDEPLNSQCISSGSDTEDEIQKVLATNSLPKKKLASPKDTRDVFEVSTEEEEYVTKRKLKEDNKTTTFFKNMKFFVSDQLSATLKIKVERYIEQFGGQLTSSLGGATYLIADEKIEDVEEFDGEIVTPLWVLECNDAEMFIPTKRYLVK